MNVKNRFRLIKLPKMQGPRTLFCIRFRDLHCFLGSILCPLSSKHGTLKTIEARFWPWLSGKSPQTLSSCSLFTRKRPQHPQPSTRCPRCRSGGCGSWCLRPSQTRPKNATSLCPTSTPPPPLPLQSKREFTVGALRIRPSAVEGVHSPHYWEVFAIR